MFNHLSLLTAKSAYADFAFVETDYVLRIEAHAPGVFRLRCLPGSQLEREKPGVRAKALGDMLLARHEAVSEFQLEPSPQGWRIEQGEAIVHVQAHPWRFQVLRGERLVLCSGEQPLTLQQDGAACWQLDLALAEDDALYGLGETLDELDRRDQAVDTDRPQDRSLPLLWSTQGWGLYINTFERVEHDLGREQQDRLRARIHTAELDVFLFVGEPSEIINQYSALTGRAGQPGVWPMGLWLDGVAGADIQALREQVRLLREQGIGVDAAVLPAPQSYGFQDDKPMLEWDATRLADPRETLAGLHAEQAQLAAWTRPCVLAATALFDEWEDRGWLLINDDDGSAYVFEGDELSGGRDYGLLDLTHKDVFRMWVERQRQMVDDGLGAVLCNARFAIPDTVTSRGGESGALLRAIYPVLARQALFDAVAGHKTPQEGIVASRDLFPSAQRFAWQLGPAVDNSWAGLEQTLKSALSTGNSGVPIQIHALGNGDADTSGMSAELYLRWLAMAVFSANFSLQGVAALRPDAFDEATQALVRHWMEWRFRLVPYVLGIIEDAVRTGLPVQRSMAQAFPADEQARLWDTQYLLGPALLVAPIMQPGEDVQVYLPAGEAWWDLSTGWRYEGGTTLQVKAGLDRLPVFGREGHMLCLGPVVGHTSEFNSARLLDEVWMFGMPEHSPVVMRNKIRVMQMQGSSYIKGLEGLKILPSEGLEVKRRGAEVRISRAR
ncbi:glycoside hydrolase family 31 protein [Alcaligenes sp. SDU_A2]|uniref:glycoside hydrolase family 31 protein n=1 Tax=Alcaligenes sp. SDU_A2 TaxID=3136634 RepID=UPI00311FCFB6